MEQFHGTTILSVRRGNTVALGGDGQVTLGHIVIKGGARKVRRLYHDKILAGFAGGTADAFTLFERFEAKLEKHQGHLMRSAVELAKALWRSGPVGRTPSPPHGRCSRIRSWARATSSRSPCRSPRTCASTPTTNA